MSEPTPPGSSPQEPTPPTFEPPASAPPPAAAPPPASPYGTPPPVTGNVAPAGFANNDEKTWALIAHFGGAGAALISYGALGWVPPLIAMLAKGNESPTVRAHAVAALNFQILWAVVSVVGYVLSCILIGFLVTWAAMAIAIIFGVIAGMRANDGQAYNYPMSINIIK